MLEIREKPNDRATVAILCPYIFFAQAYSRLLQEMPNAEIVPDYTASPAGTVFSEQAKQEFREWLIESGLPWRDIELEGGRSPRDFFAKYGTVIAPYYGGWVRNPALKAHKKVRVFYGAAKDLWGFALWNAHFDIICTPGPYFTETLNELYGRCGTEAVSTGEPKLDGYHTISKEAAREMLGIHSELPVVLVMATWGKISSLTKIAPALTSMTGKYSVIVKAHHRSSTQEPESFTIFDGTQIKVIDQKTSVPLALAAADVVMSDGSGAIFDAVRTDKPLVVIDTVGIPDDEFYIETYYGQKEEKLAGTATYAASTEQRIKRPDTLIGPVVDITLEAITPQRLSGAIEEALNTMSRYAQRREALMASHFVAVDGHASARVAHEVARIAQVKSPRPAHSSHLFASLVTDYYERAKQEEALLHAGETERDAAEARKMRRLRELPYAARLRAVIHEFFD